jgi:hypothetical protein
MTGLPVRTFAALSVVVILVPAAAYGADPLSRKKGEPVFGQGNARHAGCRPHLHRQMGLLRRRA